MPRFKNLDPWEPPGPMGLLRWKVIDTVLGRRRPDRSEGFVTPRVDNDGRSLASLDPSLTWIGHSHFALRLGGKMVLTDPVFSQRVGLATRNTAPGVALHDLPKIDAVTISHAHLDHLDMPSVVAIAKRAAARNEEQPLFVVPSEVGRYLRAAGIERIVERGWWEHHDHEGLRFTLVPQQHWSMRTPVDRDTALWGGWVIKGPEGTAYHAGDTGWFGHFGAIGERAGPIDWAMLPIGAYDPRWMMKAQHIDAEEAGRAFVALKAKTLVCMHWGTFKLTDEPLAEPPQRIARWWDAEGPGPRARERLWCLAVGETRSLAS